MSQCLSSSGACSSPPLWLFSCSRAGWLSWTKWQTSCSSLENYLFQEVLVSFPSQFSHLPVFTQLGSVVGRRPFDCDLSSHLASSLLFNKSLPCSPGVLAFFFFTRKIPVIQEEVPSLNYFWVPPLVRNYILGFSMFFCRCNNSRG